MEAAKEEAVPSSPPRGMHHGAAREDGVAQTELQLVNVKSANEIKSLVMMIEFVIRLKKWK